MKQPDDRSILHSLETEQIRPELANLDQLTIDDLIDLMCSDIQKVPDAIVESKPAIGHAVDAIVERLERGGRLIYVGAGTAGRLGMLDAAEAGPTFNIDEGQVVGVLAGGTNAFETPIENAEDDSVAGADALNGLGVSENDCVVGISASGRTPYVIGALDVASRIGALSVAVVCNSETPLAEIADIAIEAVVGPELIAGSTRMNSGTAQKIILNIISTAAMVRLGKTYGNLMIDVRPTNEKLRDRALRIVSEISGAPLEESLVALEASGWKPKVATAMLVGSISVSAAQEQIASHDGRLRQTLEAIRSNATESQPQRFHSMKWTRLGVSATLVNGELVPGDVAIRGGEIKAIGLSNPGSGIVVPGFIDAQINGFGGVDILSADADEIIEMGKRLLLDGVVAYQPTLITSDLDQLERAAKQLERARTAASGGSTILGTHLEGPFLSPQRAGTHPVNHLRDPDYRLLKKLLESGQVSMLTIAPELPGALEVIERCVQQGIAVSLGHSGANAAEAARGFDAGATAVTHLFNAMEPMSARAPGLAGAALARRGVAIQLIADGVHVADDLIKLAFAAAANRCLLVSDMIAAAGHHETTVKLGEVTVFIEDGVARRADGTIAGSIGTLRDGLTRLGRLGIPRLDSLNAVTWRPARLLNAQKEIDLRPGTRSNFFVVNSELTLTRRFVGESEVEIQSTTSS